MIEHLTRDELQTLVSRLEVKFSESEVRCHSALLEAIDKMRDEAFELRQMWSLDSLLDYNNLPDLLEKTQYLHNDLQAVRTALRGLA